MKKIFLFLVIFALSFGAKAQTWTPIFGKQRFASGLGVPVKDSTYFAGTADSALVYINPKDAGLYYKYKGNHKKVNTGTNYVPYTGATANVNLGSYNLTANNVFDGFSLITASGTQVVLTVNSVPSYLVTGSGGQTIKLPDATTLPKGALYVFNNNQSSGAILVNNNSNTLVKSVPSGAYLSLELIDNANAAGSWDSHFQAPSNVSWSTNTLDYAGSITSATWNGNTVQPNRGGTGQSTYTDGQLLIGNSTGNTLSKATLTAGAGISITNGAGSISVASTITQYTDANARAALSFAAGSGAYNSTTGVITIPTNTNQLTNGASFITLGSLSASSPLSYTNTTGAFSISQATNATNGYLSSTDWTTFNNKQAALSGTGLVKSTAGSITYIADNSSAWNSGSTIANLLNGVSPIGFNSITGAISISQATNSTNGYLSSTDWNTFNGKQNAITLTTTGSSGSATFVSNTLNVPTYTLAGLGGQPQLNGTGFVKASGTTISYDNSTYALDADVVKLAGTQTVTGVKTFSGAGNTFTQNTNFQDRIYLKSPSTSTYTNVGGDVDKLLIGVIGATHSFAFSENVNYTYTFPAASGTVALTSNLSGYVTGSGTSGILPIWNGTNSLTLSQVFDNGSTVSIGNSVTSPNKLVSFSTNASGFAILGSGSGGAGGIISAVTSGSGDMYRGSTSNGGYFISDNAGNTYISGKMGIGTFSSSSYNLNVVGTGNFSGNVSINSGSSDANFIANTTGNYSYFSAQKSNAVSTLGRWDVMYRGDTYFGNTTNALIFLGERFNASSVVDGYYMPLALQPNGNVLMVSGSNVLGNGNVLIGTSTDNGRKLQVNGASYFNSDIFMYNNGGIFFSGNSSYSSGIFQDGSGLRLQVSGSPALTLAYSTGAATFSSSVNTNGVVTITSPSASEALILNGTANSQYIAINSVTGAEAMTKYYNPTAGSWYTGVRTTAGLGSTSSYHVFSSTYSGGDVFVLNTDGNAKFANSVTVGINSSSSYGTINDVGIFNNAIAGGTPSNPAYYGGIRLTGGGYDWGAIRTIQTNPSASWLNRLAFFTQNGAGGAALTERMAITNDGLVGIGTTSPSELLTLSKNGVPQLTLENLSGTTKNTQIIFKDNASYNFRIGTDVSTNNNSNNFQIYSGSLGGAVTTWTSGGNVLVGTTSDNGNKFRVTASSGWTTEIINNNASNQQLFTLFTYGSTGLGSIQGNGAIVSYYSTSDYRLKEDLKTINGLEIVDKIKVYNYKWKSSENRMDGVLAHELAEVLPYAVSGIKDGEQMQQVDYSKIVPVMVQAIKDLNQKITNLEAQIKQ